METYLVRCTIISGRFQWIAWGVHTSDNIGRTIGHCSNHHHVTNGVFHLRLVSLLYKREEKKKDLSTRIHGRVIKALSLGSKALEFGSCVKNWYPQHEGAGCSVFFLEKLKVSLLNNRYTSIISEVKPVWTKATRGTLDQEFKTLNYAYYTQLVRMVKILRCRRPEDQA